MRCTDLPDLVGGILVEYKKGYGRDMEFGRATILALGLKGEMFEIVTNNKDAFMELNVSPDVEARGYVAKIEKIGDVFYIDTPMGWSYAVAPKGVEIPEKPNYFGRVRVS